MFPRDGAPADLSAGARGRRLALAALAFGCVALSAAALQGAFDAGDRRRALAALGAAPAGPGGPPLAELLRRRNGGAPTACEARVLSATRGVTRVSCAVFGDPVPYRFLWDDLKRDALRPEDDATRGRLGR